MVYAATGGGLSISTDGGITGNFPSAASPIPRYTDSGATTAKGGTDISDLTMFITQLTTDGNFEYWTWTPTSVIGVNSK